MALSCKCSFKPHLYLIFHPAASHCSPVAFLYNSISSHGAAFLMDISTVEPDRWTESKSLPALSLSVFVSGQSSATEGQLNKPSLSFLYPLIPHGLS